MPQITIDVSERVMRRWTEISTRFGIPLEEYAAQQINEQCADPLRNSVNSMMAGMDAQDRRSRIA